MGRCQKYLWKKFENVACEKVEACSFLEPLLSGHMQGRAQGSTGMYSFELCVVCVLPYCCKRLGVVLFLFATGHYRYVCSHGIGCYLEPWMLILQR